MNNETLQYIKQLEEELKLSNKKVKVLKSETMRLYTCIDSLTVERLKMAQYIEFLTTDNAKHIQDKAELLEEIQELQHMLDPRHKTPNPEEFKTQGVQAYEDILKAFDLDKFVEAIGGLFKNE